MKQLQKQTKELAKALPIMKTHLIEKIWGEKRCEMYYLKNERQIPMKGMRMVHYAGSYVASFRVLDVRKFRTTKEAFLWKSYKKFLPKVCSEEDALKHYEDLYNNKITKTNSSSGEFIVWEDVFIEAYLKHIDGKQPWTYPQEKVRRKVERAPKKFSEVLSGPKLDEKSTEALPKRSTVAEVLEFKFPGQMGWSKGREENVCKMEKEAGGIDALDYMTKMNVPIVILTVTQTTGHYDIKYINFNESTSTPFIILSWNAPSADMYIPAVPMVNGFSSLYDASSKISR